jgi:ribosomal protein S18 acetylase RimI-like enzyme
MIQELQPTDFFIVKELRQEALANNPEAFGTSEDEERLQTREVFTDSFKTGRMFGYFEDGKLVGIAGYYTFLQSKMRHRCQLFGVYVTPAYRGRNIASILVNTICDEASKSMHQIHLNVWTGNTEAIALYKKLGFEVYGTEPATMMIDGRKIDDHLMVKQL